MSIERLQAFYNETFSVTPSSVGYEEWIETVELPSLPGNEEVKSDACQYDSPSSYIYCDSCL